MVVLPRGRQRATDLRFDEDVVWPADHDQMLDIVSADYHQLTLAVEAEGVHKPKPGLARTPARNPEAMGEYDSIRDRENHQRCDPAGSQYGYLENLIVAERKKVTKPLHAIPNARAAARL